MKKYILGISLMIAITVVGIAACSKSDSNSKPTPTNPDPTNPGTPSNDATVSITNFTFSPASVTIKAGGTVQWTNADSAPHTATDLSSAFNSGNLSQGQKFSFKFTTPGTYTYHCLVHSTMANATVVVTQ